MKGGEEIKEKGGVNMLPDNCENNIRYAEKKRKNTVADKKRLIGRGGDSWEGGGTDLTWI